MKEANPEIIVAFTIFFIIIIILVLWGLMALIRWIFRINEHIEILSQIKEQLRINEELTELRLRKYPSEKIKENKK